jgi:hypothetical protein
MSNKNERVTPSMFLTLAMKSYVMAHSDVTLAEIIKEARHMELRAMASGFALKQFAEAKMGVKGLSYALVNGEVSFSRFGVAFYIMPKEAITIIDRQGDTDENKIKHYCFNLLLCLHSLEGNGKQPKQEKYEQLAIAL